MRLARSAIPGGWEATVKVVLQRVDRATLIRPQDGQVIADIDEGLVLYVGFERDDGREQVRKAARKLAHLRVFEEGDSLFGRSVQDVDGELLVLFQMPMAADLSRGRRPNFSRAASPGHARDLFDAFVAALRDQGARVTPGPFRETLTLVAHNRGPFTVPYTL